jgi:diguanylate cyclase (GGDEF)-like protein
MSVFAYFNTALGSCLIIILISIDYLRKYNTDTFQRKVFIVSLGAIFTAALFDYIGLTLERYPHLYFLVYGESHSHSELNTKLYIIWSIYHIARNCGFYYGAVFIDYFSHGNKPRTKKFFRIVSIMILLYSLSVIPNFQHGYYFNISREGIYIPGIFYIIQVFISYLPIVLILIDISLAPKHIKRTNVLLIMFFVIISAIGAAIDITLRTTNLLWPCVTAGIVYIYFFIIRSNSKIDSLTGIGNRNHFYEYINALAKEPEKKDYSFIKIGLEHLSEINNNYGHLAGDNALRDISTIIKNCTRHTDFAARYGGDEFILIISVESDIQCIMDRIKNTIDTQNRKKMRPYKLSINYSYDIFTTNSALQVQDFLAHLDRKIQKNKVSS